jgi:hypothetical protein
METKPAGPAPTPPSPPRDRSRVLLAVALLVTAAAATAVVMAKREVARFGFTPLIIATRSSTHTEQIAPGPGGYPGPLPLGAGESLAATLAYRQTTRTWPIPTGDPLHFGGKLPVAKDHVLTVTYSAAGGTDGPRPVPASEVPAGVRPWLAGVLEARDPPLTVVAGLLRDPDGRHTDWNRLNVKRVFALWTARYWWALAVVVAALDALAVGLFLRARRRRAHGCCACGYDRRGLPTDAKCPECGAPPALTAG